MSILYVILGLALLVVGGEFLVRAAVALSFKAKISKMVIGLTVVSFATSAPELLVSLEAALQGHSDISLGNVIGSNIANIGLVLGITTMISPLVIERDFYMYNWPILMVFSGLLYFFLQSGALLSKNEGLVLLLAMAGYLYFLIRITKKTSEKPAEDIDDSLEQVSNFKMIVWLLIGGVSLWGGAELLVSGAVGLASMLGVSERVISVTVIAVGTSVPELAASIIAAVKQEKALSLGNLIGSNIFNIAFVLGLTSMIQPIVVKSDAILSNDIFWMLSFAFVLLPLAFLPKRFELGRFKGLLLLIGYGIFVSLAFVS